MVRSICTRKSEFTSSESEVGGISQPQLRNPRWLLRASTVVKAGVIYSFLALLSICVSLNQSYAQYCPTSTRGHVAMVFVCAKCRVTHCYPLVLLTMANMARTNPSTTKVFTRGVHLGFFRLVATGTRSTQVRRHSQLRLPTSEVNGTQHELVHQMHFSFDNRSLIVR